MAKLETFVHNTVDFAEQVGEDVKALRQRVTTTETDISNKVDKEAGKGLSEENYTSAEKQKLAGLESSKWKGTYTSLSALQSSVTNPEPGDYADVDTEGEDVVRYIWDDTDGKWVPQQSGTGITASQVKQMYESNPDTNAYTDAEKSKLAGIESGAQVNTVTSVAGKTGAVTLVKGDVGLGNVENYKIASKSQAESAAAGVYMTGERVQDYVNAQVGDDNPLSIYNTAAGN